MTTTAQPCSDLHLFTESRFTPAEAAKILKLSRSSVYLLMDSGELGHYDTRPRRIGQHHITAFLRARNRE